MLKGISPLLSPDLLKVLCVMGHGDEIVFCDAHFPAESINSRVIRADGLAIESLLEGVMPLFELDQYVDSPVIMMQAVEGDRLDPSVEISYSRVFDRFCSRNVKISRLERFEFYERAKKAFAVVATGDTAQYANVILKKGVIL